MKEQILDNIYSLYKYHVVTAIIFFILMVLAIMTTIGVIKFNLIKSSKERWALVVTIVLCSVLLIVSQVLAIAPIYKDYSDSSYTTVENAIMVIKGDSSGVLARTSTVIVKTSSREYELKMLTDIKLDVDAEYTGTVVFLKNSKYIVWYEFD